MEDKNLAKCLANLSAEITAAISSLQVVANAKNCLIYLVGGAVRDLLLGCPVHDVDVVVLGKAEALARAVAPSLGKLTLHPAFGTATIACSGFRLDLSTARTESYAYPGALPSVHPGNISDDLRRRDFTINAMAISLNRDDYGQLIDNHNGQVDLKARLIRVMHAGSFADDPTRIWRAVRYEQRLGFNIEPRTLRWLKQDLTKLRNITGDRIWYELECTLRENAPEKALTRLSKLGALGLIHPSLRAGSWLAERYGTARDEGSSSVFVYFALLAYRLREEEIEILIESLHLNRALRDVLQNVPIVKAALPILARPSLRPSTVYRRLHGHNPEVLKAVFVATTSRVARSNLELYQTKLKKTSISLSGDDLIQLGLASGPRLGKILDQILWAKLDGHVKSRRAEISLAKTLISR